MESSPGSSIHASDGCEVDDDGSRRPRVFGSLFAELSFCFSIVLSQILAEYFISGFNVIVPTLVVALDIPEASSVWPTAAFALTAGSSLLIFGRLVDIYGGQRIYILGLAWYLIWTVVAGFAVNEVMLDVVRALQGFGPAAFLTAGLSLLGSVYSPGRRKNLVFSIYGGSAPVGFFVGIFVGGLTGQYLRWGWYFWIGGIFGAIALASALYAVPWDFDASNKPADAQDEHSILHSSHSSDSMDWMGSILFFVGLILLIFATTASAHAPNKWATPYVWVLFMLACLILIACIYVEGWIAKSPLLPPSLFRTPQLTPFIIAQFLSFGVLGVWLFYATLYIQNIMGASPLLVVAWFVPFGVGGLVISAIGGLVLHLIPGWIPLMVSGIAWVLAPMLVALAPEDASYWAWIFPSMLCATIGVDISYNVASIFITTSLPEDQQGLAGAVFNTLLFLGISFFLAFADFTAAEVAPQGLSQSYKAGLWFGVGCAGLSLIILACFVRMGKANARSKQQDKSQDRTSEDVEADTGTAEKV